MKAVSLQHANSVTKDFLRLSHCQGPGILLAQPHTKRRLFLHHLKHLPLDTPHVTRHGNAVVRYAPGDTVTLANSIAIPVPPAPPPASLAPTLELLAAVPADAFAADPSVRDAKALELLERGKTFNAAGDFRSACGCFEAAYALSIRAGMLVSAANMRLKMDEPSTAAAMYHNVLSECSLLPAEAEMARRKLNEATAAGGGDGKLSAMDTPPRAILAASFEADFDGAEFDAEFDLGGDDFAADFASPRSPRGLVSPVQARGFPPASADALAGGSATAATPPAGADSGLEARLLRLEEAVAAAVSAPRALEERTLRLEELFERKLSNARKGMEGLHERLQVVEKVTAKLREAADAFERTSSEHSSTIAEVRTTLPQLSAATGECSAQVRALQQQLAVSGASAGASVAARPVDLSGRAESSGDAGPDVAPSVESTEVPAAAERVSLGFSFADESPPAAKSSAGTTDDIADLSFRSSESAVAVRGSFMAPPLDLDFGAAPAATAVGVGPANSFGSDEPDGTAVDLVVQSTPLATIGGVGPVDSFGSDGPVTVSGAVVNLDAGSMPAATIGGEGPDDSMSSNAPLARSSANEPSLNLGFAQDESALAATSTKSDGLGLSASFEGEPPAAEVALSTAAGGVTSSDTLAGFLRHAEASPVSESATNAVSTMSGAHLDSPLVEAVGSAADSGGRVLGGDNMGDLAGFGAVAATSASGATGFAGFEAASAAPSASGAADFAGFEAASAAPSASGAADFAGFEDASAAPPASGAADFAGFEAASSAPPSSIASAFAGFEVASTAPPAIGAATVNDSTGDFSPKSGAPANSELFSL